MHPLSGIFIDPEEDEEKTDLNLDRFFWDNMYPSPLTPQKLARDFAKIIPDIE